MKRALAVAVACLGFTSAHAYATTVYLESTTPVGSETQFNYGGTLSDTEGVTAGSALVIYDFAGYVPGSIVSNSPNVTASTPLTSPDFLLDPAYTDDPNIVNLVFTYNGPDINTAAEPAGTYPALTFTGISARSIYSNVDFDGFATMTVKNTPFGTGTDVFSTGSVAVPSAVPELSTWALLLAGFGLIGTALRRPPKSVPRLAY